MVNVNQQMLNQQQQAQQQQQQQQQQQALQRQQQMQQQQQLQQQQNPNFAAGQTNQNLAGNMLLFVIKFNLS